MSEQLRAVDDGNVFRPRHGEIRDLGLHRRREHESGAVLGDAAPVLGHDFDAETFELHAKSARSPRSNARSLPLACPLIITWNCASALMPYRPSPA